MKAVYIEWFDSSRNPGWEDAHKGGPMLCKSIGWLAHRDKKWITISHSFNGGTQYCDQLIIPMSCVKKIRRIGHDGDK